jgi:hypothetical protein
VSEPAVVSKNGKEIPAISGCHNIWLVAKLTGLDFSRRHDFAIVAMLMGLFILATVVIRIIGLNPTDPEAFENTARFLMSAGLAFSHVLAAFLAASFCARSLSEEFERRTLLPLLAKPVTRGQVLGGKLLACLGLAVGSYLLFVALTLLAVPTVAGQQMLALGQVLLLNGVGLICLGTLSAALAIRWTGLLAALAALAWYFGGGLLIQVAEQVARTHWLAVWGLLRRAIACLPDLGLLNQSECFASTSGRLSAGLWGGLLLYGLGWSVFFFLWTRWRFERVRL